MSKKGGAAAGGGAGGDKESKLQAEQDGVKGLMRSGGEEGGMTADADVKEMQAHVLRVEQEKAAKKFHLDTIKKVAVADADTQTIATEMGMGKAAAKLALQRAGGDVEVALLRLAEHPAAQPQLFLDTPEKRAAARQRLGLPATA